VADPTFIKRAQPRAPLMGGRTVDRGLGSRWAFLATGLILLAIFGATFVTNPDRPAAADDPAYYTWRTEALLSNEPDAMLGIHGPLDMYSSGYRVTTPVIGGLIRRIADVGPLTPTIVLAVGLRVLIPMLLAGFAYRYRRDPLIWHVVAFGSASLLVTPPFAGYLDNVMTLLFLTASLYFIEPSRTSWRARVAFFVLLLLSGMTHPTTLAIFCVVLGAMAVARLTFRRFDLRSVIRDDGPMLVTAFLSAVATYGIWKIGIWGESASLSEAALPPPAGADFFKTRLGDWIGAMRPLLNGPLFLVGLLGLLAGGRQVAEDELSRVGIVWLAPLAGVLGAVAGLTYPYYRFFNTTLAWVLLVGVGAFFLARFFVDMVKGGGVGYLGVIGLLVIAFVLFGNFKTGLNQTHWNDAADAWVKPDQRAALDPLKAYLEANPGEGERPIVFIADDEAREEVRIYGFAKLVGNVSRYAVPGYLQDRTSYYLGSLDNYLNLEPTDRDDYYRDLSAATLEDSQGVGPELSMSPLVVVADVFNETGSNAELFAGSDFRANGADVLFIADGEIAPTNGGVTIDGLDGEQKGDAGDIVRALLGALLLLLPGWLLTRAFLPGASAGETLAMIPTLAVSLMALVTILQLAVTRSPLTSGQAWVAYVITLAVSVVAWALGGWSGDGLGRDESYSTVVA
jgi:hypothetical protein